MPIESSLRASDAEREAVASALAEHYARGRLTLAELEERAALAYRAATRTELDGLMADLPAAVHQGAREPAAAPPSRVRRPRAVATGHWATWLVTAVVCLVVWLATSVAAGAVLYFWPFWVIVPWGLALAARNLGSRGCGRSYAQAAPASNRTNRFTVTPA